MYLHVSTHEQQHHCSLMGKWNIWCILYIQIKNWVLFLAPCLPTLHCTRRKIPVCILQVWHQQRWLQLELPWPPRLWTPWFWGAGRGTIQSGLTNIHTMYMYICIIKLIVHIQIVAMNNDTIRFMDMLLNLELMILYICTHHIYSPIQSQRYWESRYLLLPRQCPLLSFVESSSDQRRQQEEAMISNFVRFLDFLNHIKRKGSLARKSSTASGAIIVRPHPYN